MLIGWLKRKREAAFLARCDAEALIYTKGGDAYAEARRQERVSLLNNRAALDHRRDRVHWRRVAGIIASSSY